MTWTNNENAIEFETGYNTCTVSFTNRKFCNKVKRLHEKKPEGFEVFEVNPDGSVYARFPLSWLKITPPAKRELTEKQREELKARFAKISRTSREDDFDEYEE